MAKQIHKWQEEDEKTYKAKIGDNYLLHHCDHCHQELIMWKALSP